MKTNLEVFLNKTKSGFYILEQNENKNYWMNLRNLAVLGFQCAEHYSRKQGILFHIDVQGMHSCVKNSMIGTYRERMT